ncbi:MAG: MBL fold metallo-hydrolase [Halioglobus sp.]|nr:MBL fold metallo-hydrolase [Halioglobus sp.]
MTRLPILILTLCLVAPAVAQTAPTVTATPLQGPLHLLQGRGGNVVASVGEDGVLLVDDDFAALAPAYGVALAKLAGEGATPAYVLNTHWHTDHAGGNAYWGERKATIVAHRNVRVRMSTRQEMKALGRVVEPSPSEALPVVTYGDNMGLYFNGMDIDLQHYPAGHTDGDSIIYFGAQNVVHMGDHFFKDRFPFVDLGSGGSVAGYIANVEAVLARVDDDTVIVPGHGTIAARGDLERFHAMLLATRKQVREALAAGSSVDDVVNAGLGEQWASWGSGFVKESQWIMTLAAGR